MRILGVDDDRATRLRLHKAFTPLGEVVAAGDGQEALAAMRELEKGHGVAPGKEARVMMATGCGDAGNVTRAFLGGQASDSAAKPLHLADLPATLRGMGCAVE